MNENNISNVLKKYRRENNLLLQDITKLTGLSYTTIRKIESGKECGAGTVKIFAEKLSDIFEPYIEYTICIECGGKFIPRSKNNKTCSVECGQKNARKLQKRWKQDHRNEELEAKRRARKEHKKEEIIHKNRPKAEEFERISREAGMTYGQRQSLERLGLLQTG